jgi:predicted negative regulator of RcsB-dependent stress response
MARHKESAAAETLHEIESAADRLGDWVQSNLALVVSAVVGLLVVVGLGSYIARSGDSAEQAASQALAETRNAYLAAMGAGPGSIDVPELANAEAAARIRAEYTERFGEIADAHAGTVSGALARLEVAQLATGDAGVALYEQILEDGTPNSRLRGIVLQQLAQELESAERWAEAGGRHEEAANLAEYPLRHWALADAARCFHAAGNTDRARALKREIQAIAAP